MANTPISGLASAVTVAGADVFPSVQTAGVGPVKSTLTQLTNYALANAAAGAEATPSIAASGDPNTGIWFPSADTLAVSTGGTQRVTVSSTGNVGIGVSPSYKLDVAGQLNLSDGQAISWAGGSSTKIAASNAGNAIGFTTSGTETFRAVAGNVLIGTSVPGASKLVVNDSSIQINTAKTPASATAAGTTGQVCWDSSFIYVCVATNTWKRVAIATW